MPRKKPLPALTHAAPDGSARMVNVGAKPITHRIAVAEGFVRVSPGLAALIRAGGAKKGPVLEIARLAGIQGAKRTSELIPLCHNVPIDHVDVQATLDHARVRITATVRTHARTGIEMEALSAVCIAALTIIDMGKAVDREMTIEGVRVIEKRGGKSGTYIARRRSR